MNSFTVHLILPNLVNRIVRSNKNEFILFQSKSTLNRKTNILMTLTNRTKKRSMSNLELVKLVADQNFLTTVSIKPSTMSRPMMNMERLARIGNPLSKETSLTKARLAIKPDTRSLNI